MCSSSIKKNILIFFTVPETQPNMITHESSQRILNFKLAFAQTPFFRFHVIFCTKSSGHVIIDVEIQKTWGLYQLFSGFELADSNCEYSFEVGTFCCILFLLFVFVFSIDLKS